MQFGFVVADNDYFFIVRQYRKDIIEGDLIKV